MKCYMLTAVISLVSLGLVTQSHAQINLAVYSTGISTPWYSSTSTTIADGVADPHWTMKMPGSSTFTSATVATANAAWVANNTTSKWINNNGNGALTSPVGDYVYRTTFNIGAGINPATVQLIFSMSSDNNNTAIALNGTTLGLISSTSFNAMSSNMTINSGFQTGTNTLDFTVNNAGTTANPQGLRVKIVSAAAIPEPTTLSLALMGLASSGFLAHRRSVITLAI
jgi:hypothetical protein